MRVVLNLTWRLLEVMRLELRTLDRSQEAKAFIKKKLTMRIGLVATEDGQWKYIPKATESLSKTLVLTIMLGWRLNLSAGVYYFIVSYSFTYIETHLIDDSDTCCSIVSSMIGMLQ